MWAGVGACPAVEGRRPGRIRWRPASEPGVGGPVPVPMPGLVRPVRIFSTQTSTVAGVRILYDFIYFSTKNSRVARVRILFTQTHGAFG